MNWVRLSFDFEYIFLNHVVNKIPLWIIRKIIYKFFGMTIGNEARVAMGTTVICPDRIRIFGRSVVNENCLLDGRGGLDIGFDVSISAYTKIISASHYMDSDSFEYYTKKVIIRDHVWIGTSAIVLEGTILKSGVVVGAGSVVKGIIEENAVMIGNPAKKVKERKNKRYKLIYKAYFR